MGATGSKFDLAKSVDMLVNEDGVDIEEGFAAFCSETISLSTLYETVPGEAVRHFITTKEEKFFELVNMCSHTLLDKVEEGNQAGHYDRSTAIAAMNCLRALARLISVAHEFTTGDVYEGMTDTFWTIEDGTTLGIVLANAIGSLLFGVGLSISSNAANSKIWEAGVGVQTVPKIGRGFDSNRTEILRCMLALCSSSVFYDPDEYGLVKNRWVEAFTGSAFTLSRELFYSLFNIVLNYDPRGGWGIPFANLFSGDEFEALFETSLHVLIVFFDYTPPRQQSLALDQRVSTPTVVENREVQERAVSEQKSNEVESEAKEEDLVKAEEEAGVKEGEEEAEVKADEVKEGEEEGEKVEEVEEAEEAKQSDEKDEDKVGENEDDAQEAGDDGYENKMIIYLSEMKQDWEVQKVIGHITYLLFNHTHGQKGWMSIAYDSVEAHTELLILLWRCLTENRACMQFLILRSDLEVLLTAMLSIIGGQRKSSAAQGPIHIVAFILLLLSSDRNFAVRLNQKCKHVPDGIKVPSGQYCLADHTLMVLYKCVIDSMPELGRLKECFLTVMTNLSPYIRRWSMAASESFCRLFDYFFSERSFLQREEDHVYLAHLFDFVNNVLQYQYADNPPFLYALLRRERTISRIIALAQAPLRPPTDSASAPHPPSPTTPRLEKQPSVEQLIKKMQNAKVDGEDKEGKEGTHEEAKVAENVANVDMWRRRLAVAPAQQFFNVLAPAVENFCKETSPTDEGPVVHFIGDTNLVGVLPQPHPIVVHKYQPNDYTDLWFSTYTWGVAFVRQATPYLFEGPQVKLFSITTPDEKN